MSKEYEFDFSKFTAADFFGLLKMTASKSGNTVGVLTVTLEILERIVVGGISNLGPDEMQDVFKQYSQEIDEFIQSIDPDSVLSQATEAAKGIDND